MPAGLCRHVAFRVYIYLKNRGIIADTDLARAYAVQQCPRQRDLWRAFLVTEASFDQIAAFLNERVQVIRLFSQLFWNVRPWLKDGTYMTDLLRLNTVGPVDPALALMRLGYDEGALRLARTVELAHGASSPESLAEQYDRLERRIVSRANVGMDYGLDEPKANPTLREARALLLARKKQAEQEQDDERLRLYPEGLFEVWLPAPPLEEQDAIIAHIAKETAKLDALRAAAENSIALLKERRGALISAAVTGKIRVTAKSEVAGNLSTMV
jgi:hypothetical protein